MKKTLLIIAGLLVVALLSCSSSHDKSGSSLVTIKVGSNRSASLSIQQATVLARLKNFLAEHLQVRSAEALIPTNVASLQVMVTAGDMPTISQSIDVAGLSSVTIIIEVPNGLSRHFVITGFEGLGSMGNIAFWGDMFADLNGSDVYLPVPMINLGSVTGILYVSTSGNDATGDGTEQNPYRTISQALSASTGTPEAIFVGPGTYDDATGGESFPLQLNPGTALVGLGANNSSIIDSTSSSDPVISGNVGASVQYFTVRVCDATGISDTIGGGSPAPTLINNVLLDDLEAVQPGCGPLPAITLGANSTVSNTRIKNSWSDGISITGGNPTISFTAVYNSTYSGIAVTGGNPTITNNNIVGGSAFGDGISVAGGALIDNNTINGLTLMTNGILITSGTPTISNNTITNSITGIFVSDGAPVISGNMIDHNSTGISIFGSTANPIINGNSIFCNLSLNLSSSATTTIDMTSNSWENAPPLVIDTLCSQGTDICYNSLIGPAPKYIPYNPAVPGVCIRPPS